MGHSSLQVSLTYLRGLEVTELKEEDMPIFIDGKNHSSTTNEIK